MIVKVVQHLNLLNTIEMKTKKEDFFKTYNPTDDFGIHCLPRDKEIWCSMIRKIVGVMMKLSIQGYEADSREQIHHKNVELDCLMTGEEERRV